MTLMLGLLLSLALPLLAGLPWLLAVQGRRAPGNWPLALGYGYVLGLLITVAGMRGLALVHLPLGLAGAAMLPVLAAAIGWWRMRSALGRVRETCSEVLATWRGMRRPTRIICAVILALIALRLLTLGMEVLLRPIFPWEAVSATAAMARAWYETGSMPAFVSPAAWLDGLGSFTDAEPTAPSLPSLLLAWTAFAAGQWHEGAVGIPWWMLGVATTLTLYGHLRRAGGGVAFALCAAYVFVSLPLVDLHIALAGAPQWIGAAGVGLAGCALLRWLGTPSCELLICFAIGAVLAVCSTESAWSWMPLFASAVAMRRWPRLAGKVALIVPLLVLFTVLALMQTPLKIGGSTFELQVASGWGETVESLFLLDNWHLLYGFALLVAVGSWRRIISASWLPPSWMIAMGLGILFIRGALTMNGVWYGGLRDFSYAALQFAPSLVLWTALAARAAAVPSDDHHPPAEQRLPNT